MPSLRRALLLAAVLAAAVATPAVARAATVLARDANGRQITFDVRVPDANVAWYTSLLASTPHGNEISTVTIRIASRSEVVSTCGSDAVACYGGRVIVVPNGTDRQTAHAVIHEYGHHLDSAWAVAGAREPNGTPVWWANRGIAALLAAGSVAYDYSLGWERSIGEIFAEDYTWIQLHDSYGIDLVSPPGDALRTAMLNELGGSPSAAPPPSTPTAPRTRPVVVNRSGTLFPGRRRSIPFRLLGTGRHVTFAASVGGASLAGARATLQVSCDGSAVATKALAQGRRTASLDLPNVGPASCEAVLASTTSSPLRYAEQLRLSLDQAFRP